MNFIGLSSSWNSVLGTALGTVLGTAIHSRCGALTNQALALPRPFVVAMIACKDSPGGSPPRGPCNKPDP